jgi:glycine cleavage system regulatory protein
MKNPIVLTVIADDQPGIVNHVSRVLKEHDGNWTHSSMSHLAGRFAGILMANVPVEREAECLDALHALDAEGIQIIARKGQKDSAPAPGHEYTLDVVGNDRPGIVADITRLLASHGVNVHGMETKVEPASMAGGELFRAQASLHIPEAADVGDLEAELEAMANDLMVEIRFEN